EMGRKPVLLGRSMERYSSTAEQMKLVAYPQSTSMFGNRRTVERTMRRIMKTGTEQFVPIVTGNQGEPGAVLTRIVNGETPYKINPGDKVLFSANVIPNPLNYGNRYLTEVRLRMAGARIFDRLHVSGHAYREDHYELLQLLKPQHIVPAHAALPVTAQYVEFAADLGYSTKSDLHLMQNGQRVKIH
ncbi:MAG TPA: MBL fold metallo-hydrolase RNA specificity domain-containing protein, partial [Methanoregulaceae archaeon]|nr:MBL fold metallo-hydrolase RNA specificity domain-containing protein [Methanoregulaceae archaeon]